MLSSASAFGLRCLSEAGCLARCERKASLQEEIIPKTLHCAVSRAAESQSTSSTQKLLQMPISLTRGQRTFDTLQSLICAAAPEASESATASAASSLLLIADGEQRRAKLSSQATGFLREFSENRGSA